MGSTRSLHESEIVISFFHLLQEMVKHPDAKRLIRWRTRYFNQEVDRLSPCSSLYNAALLMREELALCERRRRSRVRMYDMASIDWVCGQYWIVKTPAALMDAWKLFQSGRYRTEV